MLIEGIVRDGRGAEFGEGVEGMHSARFQKEETFADALEEVRLVFDEKDGLASRPETGEAFRNALAVFGADAGDGFVEQEQAGVRRSTAGEGEELLLAVGNFGGGLLSDFSEEIVGEERVGIASVSGVAFAVAVPQQKCPAESLTGITRQSEEDILPNLELPDEAQVLERARHAHAADAEGSTASELPFAQTNDASGRPQEAGDEVEQRGLARAVAAEQAGDGVGAQFKARPIQDGPARKMKGHLLDCEHSPHRYPDASRFTSTQQCENARRVRMRLRSSGIIAVRRIAKSPGARRSTRTERFRNVRVWRVILRCRVTRSPTGQCPTGL